MASLANASSGTDLSLCWQPLPFVHLRHTRSCDCHTMMMMMMELLARNSISLQPGIAGQRSYVALTPSQKLCYSFAIRRGHGLTCY